MSRSVLAVEKVSMIMTVKNSKNSKAQKVKYASKARVKTNKKKDEQKNSHYHWKPRKAR